MADDPRTVTATCAHCWRTPPQTSCPVGPNAGYHCLCAQGWYRTPSKSRNWSCPRCCQEGGYWKAPVLGHMSCVHGRHDAPPGLHADAHPGFRLPGQHADAPPGLPRQTPPRPAESTRDAPGQHADAPPGLTRQTPPRPAESTRDVLNNIQREIEIMNARLAELSLSVQDLLGRQQNAENAENVENADEPGAAVRLAD